MKNNPIFYCLVALMFIAMTVSVPVPPTAAQTDTTPPRIVADSDLERFRFLAQDGKTPVVSAPHTGTSYYTGVRNDPECKAVHGIFNDAYIMACPHVTAPGYSIGLTDSNKKPVAFWKAGEKIYIRLKFTEDVKVNTDNPPTLHLAFLGVNRENDGAGPGFITATLVVGEGTEADSTRDMLTFEYTVQERDDCWGDGVFGTVSNEGIGHNPTGAITDLAGNSFDFSFAQSWGLRSWIGFYYGGSHLLDTYTGALFGIDTFPANVRITGLITSATHDAQDRRNAYVDFSKTDPRADVTESVTQTGAFDVEIRFFNYGTGDGDGVLADDPQGFEPDDISITGAGVNREDWDVELALIGLDHRDPGYYDPLKPKDDKGRVKNSSAFLVYKATITPPIRGSFNGGEVQIRLPEGATEDIAGNPSLASNTLTVTVADLRPPVVIEPPTFVEKPEGEVYTLAEKISVEVTFDEEDVVYVGDAPPYVTLYLGERTVANARHATWQRGSERSGSTKVTFAYPIQVGDSAESVSLDPSGVSIPRGTFVRDGDGNVLAGTAPLPVAPTERVKVLPTREETDTAFPEVTESRPPAIETPILPVFPIFEEAAPKAAASDVPRSPIVFNELGNGSGDTNDWLELRNVTGSAVSLKDWELSVVQDGKKEDTSLVAFVEDVSVPANGLLLITNSDPTAEGNLLAGGDNVATSAVETKGSSHLYLVKSGLSLPDDGKFLLILRNAKEKLGLNAAFVDVAGGGGSDTDAFVRDETGDYDTHVWPLQVLQAPGGDTEDALGAGKVWQRAKADIVGYHKEAWTESAFTGRGYDRKVTESAATAGTPGYPNGAVKTEAATPKGSVTLSEIMFDSAGGTLPQWIELYNNSKTDAINLNRWQLELQNVDSEDLDGRPIVTLTLGEKVIQPNQTLLIVAGPARASSGSYLPADRVYDLLALHEKNLRIKSARDTFLSTEGFYLKLTDRNGHLVDEVGNKDSDRRSDDAPAWALPMSSEAGSRSSLIRRYDKGVALPGQKRASWVLAARIKPFDERLHYGHAKDIGTPGHREGGALPVELSTFSMTRNKTGAVVLTWTTESEVDNAGFNVRRSEKRASGFTLLNPALIAGAGTTGERQMYTFTDTSAKPGVEYYYQIEEVAFDGKRETLVTRLLRGPVSAANRMLTSFGEVKKAK